MSSLKGLFDSSRKDRRSAEGNIFKCNFFRARFSRRWLMALLLFVLLIIERTRNDSFVLTIATFVILKDYSPVSFHAIGEWGFLELNHIMRVNSIITIIAQIPGAILIFKFSSHKYLITTVVISSIVHMLIPIGLHHHSVTLVILVIVEAAVSASVENAVISIWKDWAPPSERTRLITFCLSARVLGSVSSMYYHSLFSYFTKEEHFYVTGIAGLIWALFWYCSFANTPENDPLISEKELSYLEDVIPAANRLKIKLSDIPWKSILTSKQVYLLCLVFFKMAYTFNLVFVGEVFFRMQLSHNYETFYVFICFSIAFILLPLCSAKLADTLIQRSESEVSSIRLKFLYGGFLPQVLFLFGTFMPSELGRGIFFIFAYLFFAVSFPGFITMPLDLSAQYVPILLGFIYTAYSTGNLFLEYLYDSLGASLENVDAIKWLFLFDAIITLLCVIFFFLYADYKDQQWSITPVASSIQNNTMQGNEDASDTIQDEASPGLPPLKSLG